MANLLAQNIGTNYRGILNLDATTINSPLDTTLRVVTDGMGNASPLFLSTQSVAIGGTGLDGSLAIRSLLGTTALTLGVRAGGWSNGIISSNDVMFQNNQTGYVFASGSTWIDPLARVHVRGDGTNPIARFENSTGSNALVIGTFAGAVSATITSTGTILNLIASNVNNQGTHTFSSLAPYGTSSATQSLIKTSATFQSNATAVAGQRNLLELLYTINNTGAITGGSAVTGIFLNATETNLNGQVHNLMDLQVGGSTRLKQNSNGLFEQFGNQSDAAKFNGNGGTAIVYVGANIQLRSTAGNAIFQGNTNVPIIIQSQGTGSINLISATSLVQFNGTTNLSPALKRSGASLETRLADDSGFCNLNTGILSIQNIVASAAAIASTHKVTISIGGTTYYLLASNV